MSQRSDYGGIFEIDATIDLASRPAATAVFEQVTVAGVLATDRLIGVVPPSGLDAGLIVGPGYVSAANTVQLRVANVTAGAIDEASGTYTLIFARR